MERPTTDPPACVPSTAVTTTQRSCSIRTATTSRPSSTRRRTSQPSGDASTLRCGAGGSAAQITALAPDRPFLLQLTAHLAAGPVRGVDVDVPAPRIGGDRRQL